MKDQERARAFLMGLQIEILVWKGRTETALSKYLTVDEQLVAAMIVNDLERTNKAIENFRDYVKKKYEQK